MAVDCGWVCVYSGIVFSVVVFANAGVVDLRVYSWVTGSASYADSRDYWRVYWTVLFRETIWPTHLATIRACGICGIRLWNGVDRDVGCSDCVDFKIGDAIGILGARFPCPKFVV